MKKIAITLMITTGLLVTYNPQTVSAGFDWGKVLNEIKHSDTRNNDRYMSNIAYQEIVLDGTYYRGEAYSINRKNNEVVSENYFTLNEPSVIDIHAVGYSNDNASSFSFRLYDEDENQIGKKINVSGGNAKDAMMVLSPGRYRINVIYHCIKKQGHGEYKFKVNQMPISVTAEQDMARPESAHQIYFGSNTVNYIKDGQSNKNEHQYYSFDLQQPSNVRIYNVILGGKGSMGICVLDAEERVIDKYYTYNGIIDETIQLAKGKYFLRVEKSYSEGVSYQLRISG